MSSAATTLLLRRATGTVAATAAGSNTSAARAALAKRTLAAAAAAADEPLRKTALNDLHKELGGDMVPFAGYELPVLYKGGENGGVMKEHLWCRADGKASLFDVSHMGQVGLPFSPSLHGAYLIKLIPAAHHIFFLTYCNPPATTKRPQY